MMVGGSLGEWSTGYCDWGVGIAMSIYVEVKVHMRVSREVKNAELNMLADQVVLQRKDPEAERHHDELSINDPDTYFQGDIDLSEKQAELIARQLESASALKGKEDEIIRKKRQVLENFELIGLEQIVVSNAVLGKSVNLHNLKIAIISSE
ncbi:unnamed protein product [Gongylonema pulchrum]|uniref:Uncharacterized protein n=1 Tax=Gongylonema pulchrum TaxID=637853 RepID=A0A183D4M0_9BILA|nr:unnamed protein product [Gongylonema pulchrum]